VTPNVAGDRLPARPAARPAPGGRSPSSAPGARPPSSAPLAAETRAALADDLIDELAGWSPTDRLRAFTKWHQGSLSLVQLIVLTILESRGPLPMSRLAETLDVSDASATGIVDRMEKRGLVERGDDPNDRRVVLVRLTPEGAGIFRDHQQQRRGRLAMLVDRLSDDELGGLLLGLRGLRAAVVAMHAAVGDAEAAAPDAGGPPTSGDDTPNGVPDPTSEGAG
jgi:DNA-binding MarR family transcriptional regulator